jgi:hypothetical protein
MLLTALLPEFLEAFVDVTKMPAVRAKIKAILDAGEE